MRYQLKQSPQVKQQLRLVPDRIQPDVAQAILDLREDPYPADSVALRDHYADLRKIKIDGWRILYKVNEPDRLVTVVAVKRRNPDTYRSIW